MRPPRHSCSACKGFVRQKCLEAARWRFVASADAISLSLFQLITRGDPPDGDDVYPLFLVPEAGGRALLERGIDICHETVRFWWKRFERLFAAEIRRHRQRVLRAVPQWRWHLDEVFVKINVETHDLWRAVAQEGEVLEVLATKQRDRKAALKFPRRAMRPYGKPEEIVTDRLRSYGAAMRSIGIASRQLCGCWLDNRAENSHQPFRRREGAMAHFRDLKSLQKLASAHTSIHDHVNLERHLTRRSEFKENRSAALAEWRQLAA